MAQCAHTASHEEARAFVESIRKSYPDATHNCWAYVAGLPGQTDRIGSSDDGEPSGTAGRPMLQILLHCGVGEICVVVSRWFGGVKLGTGGLVRAYQDSVRENLLTLPCREHIRQARLSIEIDYPCIDGFRHILPSHEAFVERESFDATAKFVVCLPEEQCQPFVLALAGISKGAARCTRDGEIS